MQTGPFLTIDEVAALLCVSTRTVRRRLESGALRRAPLGGRIVRIPAAELNRLAGYPGQFLSADEVDAQ